jgi:hypothetical protein
MNSELPGAYRLLHFAYYASSAISMQKVGVTQQAVSSLLWGQGRRQFIIHSQFTIQNSQLSPPLAPDT